jgi:hypothetical protein
MFSARTAEQSTRKTTKNTTSDSAAIEFTSSDFGNGLEFGQGFGNTAFGDDGFGTTQSPSKKDQKPPSSQNLGSDDAFDAFKNDPFGGGGDFGIDKAPPHTKVHLAPIAGAAAACGGGQ